MNYHTPEMYKCWDRWFKRVRREFCPLVREFAGQPITYVEVGCWAGASGEWMSRNVLTNAESRGFGIDPYPIDHKHNQSELDAIQERAKSRIASAIGERWTWMKMPSSDGLIEMGNHLDGKPIDILYLDGDHSMKVVILDFVTAWPFLRIGSLVIFDDYLKQMRHSTPHVKDAYENLMIRFSGQIEQAKPDSFHYYQRAVKVIAK